MRYLFGMLMVVFSVVPVRAYTLEKDPSSPTGYSYGTGPSTVRVESTPLDSSYSTQVIYRNGSPSGRCSTVSTRGYGSTFCTQ